MNNQDLRSVGCCPVKFAFVCFGTDAAPEDGIINTKTLENLWQLRDVTEAIGNVANAHPTSKLGGSPQTDLQVAYQRLAADEKLVGL